VVGIGDLSEEGVLGWLLRKLLSESKLEKLYVDVTARDTHDLSQTIMTIMNMDHYYRQTLQVSCFFQQC